ncbi:MBL fold metallo-hydrolase [Clostridium beijerinckii]|uniref:MBL fold metallo-hydrolase n=1 Tax=Clostridium beijerinckii TaxID=1520 RepID=UPI0014940738|nr:MBL fold metallo-hydrolase [Clostridium beijerinckii]NOW04939.1 glyoxylase-like metal-dependent hydrolase (beta-lactamase superfamily II) [Clostridium beijerinckii]NRT35970.1 glyoxylase-like metal-dependent hydrolase (beta-lactamase superfamily II) [Clostridium beijerinckii]NRT44603.1 glyoxylase-like metal-dependent hydrolase (beta-lactamase superfamily II) [Clostridium beijerinckii]NRZ21405.1 glyoxylase-like metal-dependent hydrolase (beta-lactamase superfamily II) [Clostridium beijerinckii
MKIAEGLDVLELGSEERRMNATLIWDDKNVILIDAGLPGQIENIREEVEKAGVSFDRINKIIITHHDLDHIGSLSSIVKNSKSEIEVLAHSGERPYIEGDKIGIKFTPERLSSMPDSMKETIKQLKTKVNRIVKDEENLPYCGGIEVIYTPGHTPGHICLYLRKYKALVTGDAMNVVNNELIGPNPEYTFDMKQAMESLKKLTKYDIETVICYHGGVFTKSSNERIAKLANS